MTSETFLILRQMSWCIYYRPVEMLERMNSGDDWIRSVGKPEVRDGAVDDADSPVLERPGEANDQRQVTVDLRTGRSHHFEIFSSSTTHTQHSSAFLIFKYNFRFSFTLTF